MRTVSKIFLYRWPPLKLNKDGWHVTSFSLGTKMKMQNRRCHLGKMAATDIWWCHFELHSVLQPVGEDTFSSSSMAICPVMSSAELSCFHFLSKVLKGGRAYSFTAADHNAFSCHPSLCAISGGHSQSDETKLLWQQVEIRRRNDFSPLWWHKSTVQPNSHPSQKAQESLTCVWPSKALQESCDEINKMWNIKLYSLIF